MSERKLASIQKIISVEPIEGADKIELVRVLGWQCVTQKSNNFKPGDLVIYFEIDSLLPAIPAFEFLRHKPEETEFKLKTIKLRGKFSQGLILPLSVLLEVGLTNAKLGEDDPLSDGGGKYLGFESDHSEYLSYIELIEGTDLTELLGIKKYEPVVPAELRGLVKGQRPHFVSKTDEMRIQAIPALLERHKGKQMYMTEKIDGTSISIFWYNQYTDLSLNTEQAYVFGVCSRNMELLPSDSNAYWEIVRKHNLKAKMGQYDRSLVLQGELFGEGIQGNKLKQKGRHLRIYNVYDLQEKKFLNLLESQKVIDALGLEWVPIVGAFVLDHNIDQLVEMSKGRSLLGDAPREGIVIRPTIEDADEDTGRLSFKVINPEFLVKYGE